MDRLNRIELVSPLDMHVHFRTGEMLKQIAPLTAATFAGALVMPNVVPKGFDSTKEVGITSLEMLEAYREEIQSANIGDLQTYLTLFFQTSYTREFLEKAKPHIIGIKLYPQGMTTNSHGGVDPRDPKVHQVLAYMQELDIPLCVHGEAEGFVLDREASFLNTYDEWATAFPRLRIVMEHITTAALLPLLRWHPNIYATVTAHHLLITLNDVIGGMLDPHLFCKPVAKLPSDKQALRGAVFAKLSDIRRKIMLGTDSAPHAKNKKESACGCAGVFTAPIALQLLAHDFAKEQDQDGFQNFVSDNAQSFYKIVPPRKVVVLERKTFDIPENYGELSNPDLTVTPMWAGRTLDWSVQ